MQILFGLGLLLHMHMHGPVRIREERGGSSWGVYCLGMFAEAFRALLRVRSSACVQQALLLRCGDPRCDPLSPAPSLASECARKTRVCVLVEGTACNPGAPTLFRVTVTFL